MKRRLGAEQWEKFTTSPWPNEDGKAQWHPVTKAIVWLLYRTGIPSITPDNTEKVIARFALYEAVNGADIGYYHNGGEVRVRITEEDVKNHIGVRTNTSPMTDLRFLGMIQEKARTALSGKKSAQQMVCEQFERTQRKAEDENA
jgi:hypothetical protein